MTALDSSVLVLNRLYQPIHVTTVRRAFTLLYQGSAKALDREFQTFDFESWAALAAELSDRDVVATVARAIKVPRVIILQVYERLPRVEVRFSRQNVYLRDRSTCQYCGRRLPRSELNLDHVIPRARGGRTTWENVVCSCVECNLAKGCRTPQEAGLRLLRRPARPRWSPFERGEGGGLPHEEWRPFVDLAAASYWNAALEED
jgi:5-methylcytosine-specific restriction endonuclease McrA